MTSLAPADLARLRGQASTGRGRVVVPAVDLLALLDALSGRGIVLGTSVADAVRLARADWEVNHVHDRGPWDHAPVEQTWATVQAALRALRQLAGQPPGPEPDLPTIRPTDAW